MPINLKNIFKSPSLMMLSVSALLISTATVAADPQSAQQALEQLRMLQQKLSTTNAANSAGASNAQIATSSGMSPDGNSAAAIGVKPIQAPKPLVMGQPVTVVAPAKDTDSITASEESTIGDLAFKEVTDQLFPLSVEEIIRLKQMYHTTEYAQASTAGTPPKPTATSQIVNLSPGSTPPVIRLSQGFVSSLVFLDSTGAPWPITAYDLGDPTAFNIQWDKTSNTLMIQASKLYTYGNLAVKLKGLNTPVMLTLIPGQKAVDYRVDLRIQGFGPNAKNLPMEDGIPPAASDLLLHVLEGVPPNGSSRLIVSGGDARAWILNERMYVRTNLTILSPGWIGSMTSADGMHAYELQKAPVLLVSWHGKVMQLKIEGL